MRLLFVFFVFLGILGSTAWWWSKGRVSFFLDFSAPQVSLTKTGGDFRKLQFALKASDEKSPIISNHVVVLQGDKIIEVSNENFDDSNSSIEKNIELSPKTLGLIEGDATLKVEVTDNSISHNSASATVNFIVDYTPPTVMILSQQFVASQGGVEFVLYKVGGGAFEKSGVAIGDYFFPGYPGSAFDKRLADYPDVYGSLFALPLGFDSRKDTIKLRVEDRGGNTAQATIDLPVKPTRQVDVNSKLTLSFLERKLPELITSYENRTGETVAQDDQSPAALIERFRLINETYRRRLQQELFRMIDATTPTRLWSTVFIRPVPAATTSLFGEKRSYSLDGQPAGGSLHEGLDLASVRSDIVRAVNAGKVVYSGEFGIYGQAVVIDHGLGLFSIYGHLSSLGVTEGANVEQGQEIARTGATGLAGGDHLHFEFRLGHVSVNPIEWWDQKWINDNIDGKISAFLTGNGATTPR